MKTNMLSLVLFTLLMSFAPLTGADAVVPPPDGCYPGLTTAEGCFALFSVTTGQGNTALGHDALFSDTSGSWNTGVGAVALGFNNGDFNTAVGVASLLLNDTGGNNTAIGTAAMVFNDGGDDNTAVGAFALLHNDTGGGNTATGKNALLNNATGFENTANGRQALFFNTTGGFNTAIGGGALFNNTTGGSNTALGFNAGANVTTASDVIAIRSAGANVSSTTWIGNVFGVTTQSGTTAPVIVSNTGQLGTLVSSERFKKDIAAMEKASEAILSLRPVTFYYKTDITGTAQFGLIAEEVAKVNPALVLPDKEGKPYTVRYDQVNAMLLNEFLKAHRKIQELEANNAQQQRNFAAQQKQIDALTAGLQKVSVQLEMSRPAGQTVLNDQ